jgi:hypothetical protein
MKKKKKEKVEIYTSNKRWVVVELLRYVKCNLILIKMSDGQIIKRKSDKVRPVVKRISPTSEYIPDSKKNRKRKKKKAGKKKKFSKPAYILQEYKKDMKDWKKKFYGR